MLPSAQGFSSYGTARHLCSVVLELSHAIRSIYRTVELGDGWRGVVLRTQVYFSKFLGGLKLLVSEIPTGVFDGAMVVLAMWTLNFFHPGWLLYAAPSQLRASMHSDGVELEDSKRLSGASQV